VYKKLKYAIVEIVTGRLLNLRKTTGKWTTSGTSVLKYTRNFEIKS